MKLPSWVSPIGLLEHVLIGAVVYIGLRLGGFTPWHARIAVLGIAIAHEWGDGDLFWAPAHPWNGLLDVAAYLVLPLLGR